MTEKKIRITKKETNNCFNISYKGYRENYLREFEYGFGNAKCFCCDTISNREEMEYFLDNFMCLKCKSKIILSFKNKYSDKY